jgi:hypothetical protein
MRCARCKVELKTVTAYSGRFAFGPICAKRLGLVDQPKQRNIRAQRVDDGQQDLFEEQKNEHDTA